MTHVTKLHESQQLPVVFSFPVKELDKNQIEN